MRVHRISGDPDYMTARCIDIEQTMQVHNFDRQLGRVPPDTDFKMRYIFDEPVDEGVVTDCPYFSPGSAMVFSKRLADALRPILIESGRTFELNPFGDRPYELFVCCTQLDALDPARMEYVPPEESEMNRVKAFAFRPEIVANAGIFRVKGLLARLFITDRFLECIAGQGITGLRIRPVWSSDAGPLIRFDDPSFEFERFPPGYGTTKREKRQAMRDIIAGRR